MFLDLYAYYIYMLQDKADKMIFAPDIIYPGIFLFMSIDTKNTESLLEFLKKEKGDEKWTYNYQTKQKKQPQRKV